MLSHWSNSCLPNRRRIPLITNTQSAANASNAFSLTATPSGRQQAAGSFDQQLSQALSESLQRLGVTPGEINISIRNNAGALNSRQIVITYDASEKQASGEVVGPMPSATNPFLGITPGQPLAAEHPGEPVATEWSPWDGPRDRRDAIPSGGGQVTATGAPLITPNSTPARNQYGYTGPAALNPYFTNPGNPLREGYVLGFGNWFDEASIMGSKNGPTPANKSLYATEEGAQEALRLVRQYAPDAELVQQTWGGGPFLATRPMYMISLGGDKVLNAGSVLSGYYNGGWGVTISSEADLERNVQSA